MPRGPVEPPIPGWLKLAPGDDPLGGCDVADAASDVPITPTSAYEQIASRLRERIRLGLLRQGERLPPERQLAEQLGVSRVTLRDALSILQGEGLIERRRGAGGGAVILGLRRSPVEVRAELQRQTGTFERILELRLVIEPGAARLAAERRNDDDLRRLVLSIEGLERAERRGREGVADFHRADSIFHLTIAAASRNPYLYESVERARSRLFAPMAAVEKRGMQQDSGREHRDVLEAIADGDADRAGVMMERHLREAQRALRRLADPEVAVAAG
ncbi:MAG TPA: FadR/GntR family transcriptional regulator [Candidatus Dormibacteraeota bacterium]|nr:FadR/GntR family transcriptional regulator [Candidatus Dormibacteraeota bacterium]